MTIMPDCDDLPDDLLDGALRADAAPSGIAELREAVLAQTTGVIRRRRRMRQCILAVSLAGCYAAGLATAALRTSAEQQAPPLVVASPLSKPSGETGAAKLTRQESVRRDADQCLLERGDVKEAVRRYDLFLKVASADDRAVTPEQDSWLLMALKNARSKETAHDRGKQN
jgi:hypothetical protein